jgi:hypothetical protein
MARPTVIAVPVLGEGFSLPLTFGTLRALRAYGAAQVPPVNLLPSAVMRRESLVDEEVAVLTLAAVSVILRKPLAPEQVVELGTMAQLRTLATAIHTKLVLMFGPDEEPATEKPADPKEVPPAQ